MTSRQPFASNQNAPVKQDLFSEPAPNETRNGLLGLSAFRSWQRSCSFGEMPQHEQGTLEQQLRREITAFPIGTEMERFLRVWARPKAASEPSASSVAAGSALSASRSSGPLQGGGAAWLPATKTATKALVTPPVKQQEQQPQQQKTAIAPKGNFRSSSSKPKLAGSKREREPDPPASKGGNMVMRRPPGPSSSGYGGTATNSSGANGGRAIVSSSGVGGRDATSFVNGVPSGKYFVFDTSSILKIEIAALATLAKVNVVIIPFSTVNELDDHHKRGLHTQHNEKMSDLSRRARELRDLMLQLRDRFRLQKREEMLQHFKDTQINNDDQILGCAIFFRDAMKFSPVILVTDDKFLQLKAQGEGIDCLSYLGLMSSR